MALITKIKAGSVSSLSDARYFAGMGVDWLGFDVNPQSESYVSPELYKNISGWVSGPKRIVEYSRGNGLPFPQVIAEYSPDGFQLALEYVYIVNTYGLLVFATANVESFEFSTFNLSADKIDYLVLDLSGENPMKNFELIKHISERVSILLSVEPQFDAAKKIITELPIAGLALKGSKELKTGLKDYDYSELLESLEE